MIFAELVAVQIVDLRPSRFFAQLATGDIDQGVALLDGVNPPPHPLHGAHAHGSCGARRPAMIGLGAEIGVVLLQFVGYREE